MYFVGHSCTVKRTLFNFTATQRALVYGRLHGNTRESGQYFISIAYKLIYLRSSQSVISHHQ
jgi:hypothetical protein